MFVVNTMFAMKNESEGDEPPLIPSDQEYGFLVIEEDSGSGGFMVVED